MVSTSSTARAANHSTFFDGKCGLHWCRYLYVGFLLLTIVAVVIDVDKGHRVHVGYVADQIKLVIGLKSKKINNR